MATLQRVKSRSTSQLSAPGPEACIQNPAACFILPNTSLAFDRTWTASEAVETCRNITISFTGISIWVFFILPNLPSYDGYPGTRCDFFLDGNYTNTFTLENKMGYPAIQYDAVGFHASGLSDSQHVLMISTECSVPVTVTYINFDYAIYTTNVPDSSISGSSNGRLGIIIGSIFGGIGLITLVAVLILQFRRFGQKRRGPVELVLAASFNRSPHQSNRDAVTASNNDLPWQNSIYNANPGPLANESATLVPFPPECQPLHVDSPKNRDELRAVRQMEINQRLQTAQQEMQNLASRQSVMSSEPGPVPSSSSEVRREGAEMDAIREQIRQINTRMEQLQMQLSSDWAEGLSDEPPPAYY
ncbi:hypothetical protein F5887DRAFT_1285677 [Amanita rubescens]|nr:hypothetical protein F5887DRAFT_1285677 [Amanita rubescens]